MEMRLGKWVDIATRSIRPICMVIDGGRIESIQELPDDRGCDTFLMPGFIDAHVHVESSMLTPAHFARIAVTHGTVAIVSDPHEIANVLGVAGVEFMLDNARGVPFKFFFGVPSCVPATSFETSGATIGLEQVETLLDHHEIHYLAEMMNFPGVLNGDVEVLAKIEAARSRSKIVDGHAPGLRGSDAAKYFGAGIATDHECTSLDEAIDKLSSDALILIREGSAAKNFDALQPLIDRYPGRVVFCSDDKHPDDLIQGHINQLCVRAMAAGSDLFNVLRAACITPVEHYGLSVGQLRVGDPADFIEVSSLETLDVNRTFINGQCVSQRGQSLIKVTPSAILNRFDCSTKTPDEFAVAEPTAGLMRVMVAHDRLLTTTVEYEVPRIEQRLVVPDVQRDLLKLTVVNRYRDAPPAVAFVRGFGLSSGAIAGSVAHDSHNIIAVGTSDDAICKVVNRVIEQRGGLAVYDQSRIECLPLPIAGLMSPMSCERVAERYQSLDAMAKELGCTLQSPFMTLSFMALLVIPSLKLSDLGLFDAEEFRFVELFA